jgi:hypothetical protein
MSLLPLRLQIVCLCATRTTHTSTISIKGPQRRPPGLSRNDFKNSVKGLVVINEIPSFSPRQGPRNRSRGPAATGGGLESESEEARGEAWAPQGSHVRTTRRVLVGSRRGPGRGRGQTSTPSGVVGVPYRGPEGHSSGASGPGPGGSPRGARVNSPAGEGRLRIPAKPSKLVAEAIRSGLTSGGAAEVCFGCEGPPLPVRHLCSDPTKLRLQLPYPRCGRHCPLPPFCLRSNCGHKPAFQIRHRPGWVRLRGGPLIWSNRDPAADQQTQFPNLVHRATPAIITIVYRTYRQSK